jgi:hypothetical protein
MSDNQLMSPQHTRSGRHFDAASSDDPSSDAASRGGRGRGTAGRLLAASSGGRASGQSSARFPRAADTQDQGHAAAAAAQGHEAQAAEAAAAAPPAVARDSAASAGAAADAPAAAGAPAPAGATVAVLPTHLRDALAAVQDKSPDVRAAVLEALLVAEASRPVAQQQEQQQQRQQPRAASDRNSSPPTPDKISQLTKPVQECVSKAVEETLSVRRSLAHAKRLKEGWRAIVDKSNAMHDSERTWKFVLPDEDPDSAVRVPKPLANLMKERAGFKLTGSKDLLESERAVEIQKSIDDEFREVAVKVLSLVHDFKEYECEQHEQSISGSEAALRAQVTELYESTEISTEVRDERVAAAIEKFQKLAEKRLEEHENERREKEIAKAQKKRELNKAELEARSVRSGETFVANVSAKATEIVALNRAESEAIMLETLSAVSAGDGRSAKDIFAEKRSAAETAAANRTAAESDDDKLKRLRAEQQASAEALACFEKERGSKNGNPGQKSLPREKGQNAKKKSGKKAKAKGGGRK